MFLSTNLALSLALAAAPGAPAAPALRNGTPIRLVEKATPQPRRAFLEALNADSLWYRADARGPLLATHCAGIERVDVAQRMRGHSTWSARLEERSTASLRLSGAQSPREIPIQAVERLDLRGPGGRAVGRRAFVGGLVGGFLGAGLAPWLTGGQPEAGQMGATGGLLIGAGLGGAIGAASGWSVRVESWRSVPIEQLERVTAR